MGFADREQKRKSVIDKMLEVPEQPSRSTSEQPSSDDPLVIAHKKETRSRKANFLLKPSVHEKALKKCEKLGISMNECVNQLLERWADM